MVPPVLMAAAKWPFASRVTQPTVSGEPRASFSGVGKFHPFCQS